MAAPNLKNPTTITGITTVVGLGTTAVTGILTNTAGSNKVLKINSIFCANIDGVTAADISISIIRNGIDRYLARTIAVPADATQIISTKDTYFYLEEGVGIRAQASAANDLDVTIGYEEIS
tara:strand:+ start:161 stop:523 length:363 start_codon:yes stop_codon:yes gene_type:complete